MPCPKPDPLILLNSDLAQAYLDRGDALDSCNGDKQSLREWADSTLKETK